MATKKTNKKAPKKQSVESTTRLRKLSRRQAKKEKKKNAAQGKLPSAWKILKQSLRHLLKQKKLFIGLLLTYAVLDIIFVRGLSSSFQLANLREELSTTFADEMGRIGTSFALFGLLLSNTASVPSETAGAYQSMLLVIMSLALIWALRQTYQEDVRLRIRDALYKGMNQLIPFVIVIFFVLLQSLPFIFASTFYGSAQSSGLIVNGPEQIFWVSLFIVGLSTSLFFLSSSIFALYIVTLEGRAPREALKTARKLVRYRRWVIIRKLLFLPLVLLVFAGLTLIPLILFIPVLAEVLVMIFAYALLAVAHSYLYSLYRELI